MKIFVIPDIHLKPDMIQKAENEINAGDYDKVLFLGDFVDDWSCQNMIGLYDKTFDALELFVKNHPDSLICLGNHDLSYIWKVPQSGYSSLAESTVVCRMNGLRKLITEENIKIIHRIDNVIFSHAGLCKDFVLRHFAYDTDRSIDHIIDTINCMNAKELWEGDSPLWARPQYGCTLYPSVSDYMQVVGHTPVEKPEYFYGLLSVDTFSTYRNGKPIGDEKFVWVDTETREYHIIGDKLKDLDI